MILSSVLQTTHGIHRSFWGRLAACLLLGRCESLTLEGSSLLCESDGMKSPAGIWGLEGFQVVLKAALAGGEGSASAAVRSTGEHWCAIAAFGASCRARIPAGALQLTPLGWCWDPGVPGALAAGGSGAALFDTTVCLLCAEGNLLKDKTCEQKVYVGGKLD